MKNKINSGKILKMTDRKKNYKWEKIQKYKKIRNNIKKIIFQIKMKMMIIKKKNNEQVVIKNHKRIKTIIK